MGKLFSNVLKGIKKKPLQLIGVILLVMVSTLAYVTFNASVDTLEQSNNEFKEISNIQDFSFQTSNQLELLDKDTRIKVYDEFKINSTFVIVDSKTNQKTTYKYIDLLNDDLFGLAEDSAELANIRSKGYFDLKEDIENVIYSSIDTYEKYFDIIEDRYEDVLEKIEYEHTYSTDFKDNKTEHFYKFMSMNDNINKTYLADGKLPEADNEIAILEKYAEINGIELGSNYKIDNVEYKVVGFATSAFYTYPYLELMAFMPEFSNQTMVFSTNDTVKKQSESNGRIEVYTASKLKADGYNIDELKELTEESDKYFKFIDNSDIATISMVDDTIKDNRTIAFYFSVFILLLGVIVIAFIVRKKLDNESLTIGVLRSLGYSNKEIGASYLAYPLISSIVGGVLGYLGGLGLSTIFTSMYKTTYTIPLKTFVFDFSTLAMGILLPILILNLVAFVVILILLNKPVLDLLKPGNKIDVKIELPKPNFKKGIILGISGVVLYPLLFLVYLFKLLGLFIKKVALRLVRPFKFMTRFKVSLATRSMGRLIMLYAVIFLSAFFMTVGVVGTTLVQDIIDDTFESYSFQKQAYYSAPTFDIEMPQEIKDLVSNLPEVNGEKPMYILDDCIGSTELSRNLLCFDKVLDNETGATELRSSSGSGANVLKSVNGESKKDDDKYEDSYPTVVVTGLDPFMNENKEEEDITFKLLDDKGEEITEKLDEGLIINQYMAAFQKIEIGDDVEITLAGSTLTLEVKAIHNEFNGPNFYMAKSVLNRLSVSSMLESEQLKFIMDLIDLDEEEKYEKLNYMKFTQEELSTEDTKYAFILDFDTIKEQLDKGLDMIDMMVNVIIIVTAFISLIIITIMTNFTIEDNFKNISVLKVMGYDDKSLNKMILRVYTPFVLIATLTAIPTTIITLKMFLLGATEALGFAIPVKIDILKSFIVVVIILVTYLVSMYISKKQLKRVTLQEALKSD